MIDRARDAGGVGHRAQPDDRGDRRPLAARCRRRCTRRCRSRRPASGARSRSPTAGDGLPGIDRPRRAARSCARRWPSATDGEPIGWSELDATTAELAQQGLRVLLVATSRTPPPCRPFDDEADATLPARHASPRPRRDGRRAARRGRRDAARVHRGRRRWSRSSPATTPRPSSRSPARRASRRPASSRAPSSTTSTTRRSASWPPRRRSSAGSRRPRRSGSSARCATAATTWR